MGTPVAMSCSVFGIRVNLALPATSASCEVQRRCALVYNPPKRRRLRLMRSSRRFLFCLSAPTVAHREVRRYQSTDLSDFSPLAEGSKSQRLVTIPRHYRGHMSLKTDEQSRESSEEGRRPGR